MTLHPACLQDGKFLVEFYVSHPEDTRYNNVNQRFWLHYHNSGDVLTPSKQSMTNLIRPSDTSEDLASRKGLVPFRMWANLTHEDTYIHGPFEFATINGRKSRDRVSLDDWKIPHNTTMTLPRTISQRTQFMLIEVSCSATTPKKSQQPCYPQLPITANQVNGPTGSKRLPDSDTPLERFSRFPLTINFKKKEYTSIRSTASVGIGVAL